MRTSRNASPRRRKARSRRRSRSCCRSRAPARRTSWWSRARSRARSCLIRRSGPEAALPSGTATVPRPEELPPDLAVLREFVGLVTLDHALRAKTPIIAQRLRAMHLRPQREFLMPGARIEVTERLVLHLVHLAEN